MNIFKRPGVLVITGVIVIFGAEFGERMAIPGVHSVIPAAEAVVGRPLTPVSVAGVSRRTSRRN